MKQKIKQLAEYVKKGRPILLWQAVPFQGQLPKGQGPDSNFAPELLIGATGGMFYLAGQSLYKLCPGKFYGLSRISDLWFVYRKVDRYLGQILSLDLKTRSLNLEKNLLPRTIHQLDFIGSRLFVVDTLNKLYIFTFQDCNNKSKGLHLQKEILLNGPLTRGNKSPNYCHVNSIFFHQGHYYLMFHNTTSKTGRPSQIAVFDLEFQEKKRIDINGHDAHNICILDGQLIYCDSGRKRLVWGKKECQVDLMTRGLAISDQWIILGGSVFASRKDREQTSGKIYFIQRPGLNRISEIKIPGSGQIQEIRLVNEPDYSLSNTQNANK